MLQNMVHILFMYVWAGGNITCQNWNVYLILNNRIDWWLCNSLAKLQNDENESNVQAHHDQNQDTALILAHNRIDEKRIALSVGVYFGAEFVSITEPFLFLREIWGNHG